MNAPVSGQMLPFGDLFHHFLTEGRQIVRVPAGHQPIVNHYFTVYPGNTSILQVATSTATFLSCSFFGSIMVVLKHEQKMLTGHFPQKGFLPVPSATGWSFENVVVWIYLLSCGIFFPFAQF